MSQGRLSFRLPDGIHTFEEFLCGSDNLSAMQKAILMAENGRSSHQSAGLYLHGGPGTGKTHLLSAIANGASSLTTLLVDVRALLHQLNDAWKLGIALDLRNYLIEPDILLLDNLHVLKDDQRFQEDILSIIRLRLDANLSVAIASDAPPMVFDGQPLSSHLLSGQWDVVHLKAGDPELRVQLLRKFLGELEVPQRVVEFIAEKERENATRLREWAVGLRARRDLTSLLRALGYELISVARNDGRDGGPVIGSQWRLEIGGKRTVVDISHSLKAGKILYRCWCPLARV